MPNYAGQRVTVMGLGTRGGGLGVARYLASHGAAVTVTDLRSPDDLAESLRELEGTPVRLVLGRHDEADFTPAGADMVVRNPAVRRDAALLRLARERGVPVEMEMSLFLRDCPVPVISITGTKGKTSTATLCGEMLRAWDPRTVVAGNMGVSAIERLDDIEPGAPVVLEVSSWQQEAVAEHGLSSHIAILTNISDDHLNTYRDFDEYADVKRSITAGQGPADWLVLNADDPEVMRATGLSEATIVPFGAGDRGTDGAWVTPDALVWRRSGAETRFPWPANHAISSPAARLNAAAAAAGALLRGAPPEAVTSALASFGGVRDRTERVATIGGVLFVNDTAATAPAATFAALEGFRGRPVHLVAGGADKRADLAPLADAIAAGTASVHLLDGAATPALAALLDARGVPYADSHRSMEGAVRAAAAVAAPGDVVLLSPGCASFGLFRDEFHRGDEFRAAVAALAAEAGGAS